MTQAAVGAAPMADLPQVWRVETGERMVNAVKLRHFAALYRKRLDYFA